MPIAKEVKDALKKKQRESKGDTALLELQKFYEEMKKRGLVMKQEYTLPPLDTVGSYLFQSSPSSEK